MNSISRCEMTCHVTNRVKMMMMTCIRHNLWFTFSWCINAHNHTETHMFACAKGTCLFEVRPRDRFLHSVFFSFLVVRNGNILKERYNVSSWANEWPCQAKPSQAKQINNFYWIPILKEWTHHNKREKNIEQKQIYASAIKWTEHSKQILRTIKIKW